MPYFSGTACFSPKVPSWIETIWSMNGGKIISPRVLHPQFGETVGKVSGVDWLFGLDETDPWVKTWRANSNVVFHASYILQVVSKRVDQALVPMRNFVIGSTLAQTQCFSPNDLPEPRRDELTVRPSPPEKAAGLSVPVDAAKLSGQMSPLRSPARNFRVEKSPYVHISTGANTPPSTGPARQSALIDSLTLHGSSEQPKQDNASAPFLQVPFASAAATTFSLRQEYPRIDLIAFVREKQKAKSPRRKKMSVPPPQKVPRRRVILQDSSYEKSSRLNSNARGSQRDLRKSADAHPRRSLALKKRSISVHPVPHIFKPLSPLDCVSVFDNIGRHWNND